jgi:hypothetical protein
LSVHNRKLAASEAWGLPLRTLVYSSACQMTTISQMNAKRPYCCGFKCRLSGICPSEQAKHRHPTPIESKPAPLSHAHTRTHAHSVDFQYVRTSESERLSRSNGTRRSGTFGFCARGRVDILIGFHSARLASMRSVSDWR